MKSLGFVSCFGRRVAWEDFFIHVKLKLYMNTEISGKKTMELRASLRKMFCDNSFEWTVKNCHRLLFNSFAAEFSKLFWAISWITRLLTYDIDMSVNFQFVVVINETEDLFSTRSCFCFWRSCKFFSLHSSNYEKKYQYVCLGWWL